MMNVGKALDELLKEEAGDVLLEPTALLYIGEKVTA